MKKKLIIFTLLISTLLCSCTIPTSDNYYYDDDRYEEGYDDGFKNGAYADNDEVRYDAYNEGYDEGYDEGYNSGFEDAVEEINQLYEECFNDFGYNDWTEFAAKYINAQYYYVSEEQIDEGLVEYCKSAFVLGYCACKAGYFNEYVFSLNDDELARFFLQEALPDYDIDDLCEYE